MRPLEHLKQSLAADSSLPLYQQLARALRDAIDRRLFGPDEALPAERILADELGISRITVRKAIDGLVEEGLLARRAGSGTFVNNRVEKNFAKLTSFSEDMRARGRTPRSEWLKRSAGTVTPEEALRLRLSPGASDEEAMARLDRLLEPYGGLGAYPRRLQLSAWTLSNERPSSIAHALKRWAFAHSDDGPDGFGQYHVDFLLP